MLFELRKTIEKNAKTNLCEIGFIIYRWYTYTQKDDKKTKAVN